MKKNLFIISLILLSISVYSQVGINTETPKATLDITASAGNLNKIDGILIPRLTGDELKAKDAVYGADQVSTMVYVTEPVTGTPAPTDKTYYVTSPGFYYLYTGGTLWVKLNMDARNGLSRSGDYTILGGPLIQATTITGITDSNTLSFRSTSAHAANSYFTIGTSGGTSGGVYLGNPSHGLTRGFPILGNDNNLGLYTTNGNLFLSTNGKNTGEFILADNGNVGIGLGNTGTAPNIIPNTPSTKLHVQAPSAGTGFRLVDGSQGTGKILISDTNGNAQWGQRKAHYLQQTAAVVANTPLTGTEIQIPGLTGFTAPATGIYLITLHAFLQSTDSSGNDNASVAGNKAFYFRIVANGSTEKKDVESYLYLTGGITARFAQTVPIMIHATEGEVITFRFRDLLAGSFLRFQPNFNHRNYIEIAYIGE